jgi:8-oxo-dGTP pyrophosphatase MutT (NUDIX family)
MIRVLFRLARVYWRITRPVHLGVKGIVVLDGRVLLVRTTYGDQLWDLPGGHVHRGESAEQALVREIREETGVRVAGPVLVGVDYLKKYKHDHVLLFRCRIESKGAGSRSPEIAESKFFDLNALPEIRSATRRWLDDAGNR